MVDLRETLKDEIYLFIYFYALSINLITPLDFEHLFGIFPLPIQKHWEDVTDLCLPVFTGIMSYIEDYQHKESYFLRLSL